MFRYQLDIDLHQLSLLQMGLDARRDMLADCYQRAALDGGDLDYWQSRIDGVDAMREALLSAPGRFVPEQSQLAEATA